MMNPNKSHSHGIPSAINMITILLKFCDCPFILEYRRSCDHTPWHKFLANKINNDKFNSNIGPVMMKKYNNVDKLSSKKHLSLVLLITLASFSSLLFSKCSLVMPSKGKIICLVIFAGKQWIIKVIPDTMKGTPVAYKMYHLNLGFLKPTFGFRKLRSVARSSSSIFKLRNFSHT